MIGTIIGLTFGIIGLIFAIWMVLYALGIIDKGFQRSEGKSGVIPISKSSLNNRLLKLNNNNAFNVKKAADTDLYIEWNIIDSKWIEILGESWKKKFYKAWVLLDESKNTIRYNELILEKELSLGPTRAYGEVSYFRGVQLWRKERAVMFGIRKDYTIGEIYNYKFAPSDIKDVIRQIANENGWAFELVVSKRRASYKGGKENG